MQNSGILWLYVKNPQYGRSQLHRRYTTWVQNVPRSRDLHSDSDWRFVFQPLIHATDLIMHSLLGCIYVSSLSLRWRFGIFIVSISISISSVIVMITTIVMIRIWIIRTILPLFHIVYLLDGAIGDVVHNRSLSHTYTPWSSLNSFNIPLAISYCFRLWARERCVIKVVIWCMLKALVVDIEV